jgi:MFS transporter, DHA2 family, multidrug resistance protein
MIDMRMVATRQFGACFVVMLATGDHAIHAPAGAAEFRLHGDVSRPRALAGGLVTMVMMFVVGRLSAKVQPKYLIVAGR